jgi:hypothetical protein
VAFSLYTPLACWLLGLTKFWSLLSECPQLTLPGCCVHRNPNSEDLPHWPRLHHDEQYLKLDIQPALGQALKADRLQFWTKTLPRKIMELTGPKKNH